VFPDADSETPLAPGIPLTMRPNASREPQKLPKLQLADQAFKPVQSSFCFQAATEAEE